MTEAFGSQGPVPASPPVSTEWEATSRDPYDFSLVLGGPLFQIIRRAHLSGNALELARRRTVAISLFAWLPLLILSALGGAGGARPSRCRSRRTSRSMFGSS